MKRIFSFAMLVAAAATAFVQCTKEPAIEPDVEQPALSGETMSLTLCADVEQTRTELGNTDHGTDLKWSEGDTYGIFFVAENGIRVLGYVESPAYDPKVAEYTIEDVPVETAYLYCIYPYDSSFSGLSSFDDVDVTEFPIAVPDNTTWSDTFDGGKLPMAASVKVDGSKVNNVTFRKLLTVVELDIYDPSAVNSSQIGEITLSAGEGEYLAGPNATFNFKEMQQLTSLDSQSVKALPAGVCTPGTAKGEGAKAYFYVAPANYSKLDVAFSLSASTAASAVNYSFTFENVNLRNLLGASFHLNLSKAAESHNSLSWDFSQEEWAEIIEAFNANYNGTEEGQGQKAELTKELNGLTVYNAKGRDLRGDVSGGYFQLGGGSDANYNFMFTPPLSGKLRLVVSGTGGARDPDTDGRTMNVKVGDGAAMTMVCLNDNKTLSTLEYDVTVYNSTTPVYIYSSQGHRLHSIEYVYSDIKPTIWDFSSEAWTSVYPVRTDDDTNENYVRRTEFDQTVDGLRLLAGGKYIDFRDKDKCIQMGGEGNKNERVFSFTATSSGSLTVYASNTSDVEDPNKGEDNERQVYIEFGSNAGGKFGGYKSSEPGKAAFGVTIEEETTVYIYAKNNGLRFYSIEFDGSVKK